MANKRYWPWVLVACIGAIGFDLNTLRIREGGLRNLLSPSYWVARASDEDLFVPSKQLFKRGNRDLKELVLTFDDGPHAPSANVILDVLKKENVKATFFVVGKRVQERPQVVARMIAEGHEVGNHTENHLRLDTLPASQIRSEIGECEKVVEKACGHRMTLLRPPGVRYNKDVLNISKQLGYVMVSWNIGAKDFIPTAKDGNYTPDMIRSMKVSPEVITQRILKQVKDGDIILLHDNPVTAAALPSMIDALKERGFTFKTTAEMLAHLPTPVAVVSNPSQPIVMAQPRRKILSR